MWQASDIIICTVPEETVSKFAACGLHIIKVDIAYWTKIKQVWYRRILRFRPRFETMSYADLSHTPLAFINFAYKVACKNKDDTWRHWEYHPKKDKLRWNVFYSLPGVYDPVHKTESDVSEIPLAENEKALAKELLGVAI